MSAPTAQPPPPPPPPPQQQPQQRSRNAEAMDDSPAARPIDPVNPTLAWNFFRMFARLAASTFFGLKAYNTHYVPRRGGVLLVANHQSYLDPVLLGVFLRRHMSYLAKSELFTNKYFSWLIRTLNAFPVKQGTGDVGAVRETIKRLREGHMLNIFPEGSRSLDGEIAPLLPGAALVVKKAGVPIIPVVIEGSFKAWPKGSKLFRAHPVSVMYGPPLDVRGLDARQITDLIDRTLRTMFADLRQRHRKRVGAKR
jgi:1-acyl-sn-glycerol-3-phosphate acyltransferase